MSAFLQPRFDDIPAELRELDRWLCWRPETIVGKDGGPKVKKAPFDVGRGVKRDPHDPATWKPFDVVRRAAGPGRYGGIGFDLVAGDGIVGIDLDHCRDPQTGAIARWALDIVADLHSYTEISPSGRGLHIFVRGTLPDPGGKFGDVEVYADKHYMTVTGHTLEGSPPGLASPNGTLTGWYAGLKPAPAPDRAPVDVGEGPTIAGCAGGECAICRGLQLVARRPYASSSERFQGLVAWACTHFGDQAAREHAELIRDLAGEQRYNGRLQRELERSIGKAACHRDPGAGAAPTPTTVSGFPPEASPRDDPRGAGALSGSHSSAPEPESAPCGAHDAQLGVSCMLPHTREPAANPQRGMAPQDAGGTVQIRMAELAELRRDQAFARLVYAELDNHDPGRRGRGDDPGEEPAPLRSAAEAMTRIALYRECGPPDPADERPPRRIWLPKLAARVGATRKTVSGILDRLHEAGHIRRVDEAEGEGDAKRSRIAVVPLRPPAPREATPRPAPTAATLRRREAAHICTGCGSEDVIVTRRVVAAVACRSCGLVEQRPGDETGDSTAQGAGAETREHEALDQLPAWPELAAAAPAPLGQNPPPMDTGCVGVEGLQHHWGNITPLVSKVTGSYYPNGDRGGDDRPAVPCTKGTGAGQGTHPPSHGDGAAMDTGGGGGADPADPPIAPNQCNGDPVSSSCTESVQWTAGGRPAVPCPRCGRRLWSNVGGQAWYCSNCGEEAATMGQTRAGG